jgi:RNA polymerase sigma-70 factor (ECF subfamily)
MNLLAAGSFHSTEGPLVSEPLHHLVQAARHNDQSAWDRLFQRYQLALFAYAHGLTGNREAAFDIVQETFGRAAAHVGRLRDDGKFGSWLFGIAHQRCTEHFRRMRREDALFADDADPGDREGAGPDPRDALLSAERAAALYALVDRLPLPQRSALLLHVLGDFPLGEIAEVAGVPVGTVKSRLHHAKRAMRSLIEEGRP